MYTCFFHLNNYKTQIIQSIMLHDALHKKKLFLDALGEGLEVFGVCSVIVAFPELFRPVFVSSESVKPSDVLSILKPVQNMNLYRKESGASCPHSYSAALKVVCLS